MTVTAAETTMKDVKDARTSLSIVSAKDYAPGKEYEILEAIGKLFRTSIQLLNHNVAITAKQGQNKANRWFWNSSGEEKKCEDELGDIMTGKSGDFTTGEMDTIMDSMTFVLEVMEIYHTKAHKAASELLSDLELGLPENMPSIPVSIGQTIPAGLKAVDQKADTWTVKDAGLDKATAPAEFLFGSFMPNQIGENEYPEGSQPIMDNMMTSCGPTTDMFLGSINALLNGLSNDDTLEKKLGSKLSYLNDIESVSSACNTQTKELDSILNSRSDSKLLDAASSRSQTGSKSKGKIEVNTTEASFTYLKAAREKLSEYASLAENVMKDEIRCIVSEYTYSHKDTNADDADHDGLYFEALRTHFRSDAYNIDVQSYRAQQASDEDVMEHMLLNALHSSFFLRKIGDKCHDEVRKHIGNELSESISELVMTSLMAGPNNRVTQCGALLLAKHVRALHAYIYEFCRCAPRETKNLLWNIAISSLGVPPMNAKWKKLFVALNILKLEALSEYNAVMLDGCFSATEAKQILKLRLDLADGEINATIRKPEP